MNLIDVAIKLGRAILAWLVAALAGALIGVMLLQLMSSWGIFGMGVPLEHLPSVVAFVWVLGAISSAPLALPLVLAIRFLDLPRPWSEVIGGAGVAALLPLVLQLVLGSFGDTAQWIMLTAPSGAVAGGVYWLIAAAPSHVWAAPPR